jgi:hypothetical protein
MVSVVKSDLYARYAQERLVMVSLADRSEVDAAYSQRDDARRRHRALKRRTKKR